LSKDTSSPVMSVMLNSLNVLIAPHRIADLGCRRASGGGSSSTTSKIDELQR
jgi:hypothetical protein